MLAAPEQPYRRIGYIPEFDGLRGLGLCVVLISHTVALYPVGRLSMIPGGFLSLDMFFVLSGFLITALLLREQAETQAVNLRAFYIRRMLRLLPALFVLLAFHWCYATFMKYPQQVEHATLLSVCFYYFNWRVAFGEPVVLDLGHLWSLSVEEQFYLVWPLAIATVFHLRRSLWSVALILCVLIAIVAAHRAMLFASGIPWFLLYGRTDTRGDALLVGALAAQLWVRSCAPRRYLAASASIASVFLLACLVFSRPEHPSLYRGLFTIIALAWGVVILAIVQTNWSLAPLLRSRLLCAVGRVSYGAYLWHLPIFIAVRRHGADLPPSVRIAIALCATAIAAQLSWMLVERRFLALKPQGGRNSSESGYTATSTNSSRTISGAASSTERTPS